MNTGGQGMKTDWQVGGDCLSLSLSLQDGDVLTNSSVGK